MNRDVLVERVGNRIWLKTAYRSGIEVSCKKIPGYGFSKSNNIWTYPLDFSTCLKLRKVFGRKLVIGPALRAWAREAKEHHQALEKLSNSSSAELARINELAPHLAEAMGNRTYQQVGSMWLKTARSGLLADQPGLGKTIQVIGAQIEAGVLGPILIFCPKTAISLVWEAEIKKWLDPERELIYPMIGQKKKRQEDLAEAIELGNKLRGHARTWVICNIEMVRTRYDEICPMDCNETYGSFDTECPAKKQHKIRADSAYPELFEQSWSTIIVDESHRALITRTSVRHRMTQQRAGMSLLKVDEGGFRIALSGTPNRGKLENLWGTFNWLRPDLYTSYWRWAEKYFNVYDGGFSREIAGTKEENMTDLDRDLNSIMLRRTKNEVLPELPPKEYPGTEIEGVHGIWLDMTPTQTRIYKQMTTEALAKLDSGTLIANGVLAEMTRLKQFAVSSGDIVEYQREGVTIRQYVPKLPSNKFDWLVEFLAERGIEKDPTGDAKVVIASQFTSVINLFSEKLSDLEIDSYKLTGETNDNDRKAFVDDFQNNEDSPRVFLLNTMAGGVAVTLDVADELIFLDETYVPDDQEQVEDRIHRTSRMHNVKIYYVRSLGSIEESIARTNVDREELQKTGLDSRRGIEFARKLISI